MKGEMTSETSESSSSSSPSACDTRRRVKLYTLNNSRQWDDRGTGHVRAVCNNENEQVCSFTFIEEDFVKINSIFTFVLYFIPVLPHKLLVTFKLSIAGTSTVGCEGRSKRRCSTRIENSIRHSVPETTGNIDSLV